MTHAHVTAYLDAMGSFAAGDVDGYLALLAEDVEWWELGAKDPLVGKAAVADLLEAPPAFEMTHEIHDVLANDEHLVALIHAVARRDSTELDVSYAEVLHFDSSGKATKRQAFPSDIWTALALVQPTTLDS